MQDTTTKTNETPSTTVQPDVVANCHNNEVYNCAKLILPGMLSGAFFSTVLVSAMQRSERTTLGSIIVNEAWDMAEALVQKKEEMRTVGK